MSDMQYGRYQIVSELGNGAMGVVYQAHDPQIDRMVALKVLRQDRVVDQEFVRRFVAEARAIGRLSHPNIVTVFDVGEDHGTIYIAMEFLEGQPLDVLIGEQTFNPEKVMDVGVQVAEALDYAHRQGIIHRDIKPGNIIISPQGHVKVTDFGIARIEGGSGHQMTQMGEILGTPIYMPPEQVAGQPVDGRSDIYALGVVLYELSTGQRPFSGDNLTALFNAIGNETPVIPARLNPQIPSSFSRLMIKCLSKSPGDRFQNGQSLSDALKGCLSAKSDSSGPVRQIRKKRKAGIYVLAGLATFVIIGVVAVILIPNGLKQPAATPKVESSMPDVPPKPKQAILVKKKPEPAVAPKKKPLVIPKHEPKPKSKTKSDIASKPKPFIRKEAEKLKKATLAVQSAPSGAGFYVNGKFKGMTPIKVKLPYGKYEVRLQHEKYFGWEAQLSLDKPGEIPLQVRLIPED